MRPEAADDESSSLDSLLSPVIDKDLFQNTISRLHVMFDIYAATCPAPLPTPGLIVTHEIRIQSELYLPITDIATVFRRLYSAALTYPPILSSTPFHNAMSWADVFAAMPARFQSSANPARLLEALMTDRDLRIEFLFASFLPDRFYGGIGRYPGQRQFVGEWLNRRQGKTLKALDVACGTGESTYGLALLLAERGFSPEEIRIEGWTLEPLEVWTATRRSFPHDRRRESRLREEAAPLFRQGFDHCLSFHRENIMETSSARRESGRFDLILCNGLLGGPIVNQREPLERAVVKLSELLAPGGILLAADSFHGGWKQKCPQGELRALFETNGLDVFDAGEGIGGLKL
jgi:SAM-dependent methyltransferase